jgi:3-phosphoshikimate 1-carboxyvinyltransferase
VVRDAHELRVKETDRIASTVGELRKLGARIEPTADGFIIEGPTPLTGAPVESQGDHRLAMAMTVAGLVARGQTVVYGAEVTGDSFPGFEVTLQALGADLSVAA